MRSTGLGSVVGESRAPKPVRSFTRSTHGGATALTAAILSVATVIGASLAVDHLWLVGKRDKLKAAVDAATVAATLHMKTLPLTLNDTEVRQEITPTIERYILLNIRDEDVEVGDLDLNISFNRSLGSVDIQAMAPIGSMILSSVFTTIAGISDIFVGSGAEVASAPVWAVLAIDVSRSMEQTLAGGATTVDEERRMNIVKEAAAEFIEVVEPDPSTPVAVGVVPWAGSVYGALAPSTSGPRVEAKLGQLYPIGSSTGSSRGLRRAREMLEDAPTDTSKALIFLTDGEDNITINGDRCSPQTCAPYRAAECDAAKNADVTIYVVAAIANTRRRLTRQLTDCASSADHVFVDVASAQAMSDAFSEIGGRVKALRRTH